MQTERGRKTFSNLWLQQFLHVVPDLGCGLNDVVQVSIIAQEHRLGEANRLTPRCLRHRTIDLSVVYALRFLEEEALLGEHGMPIEQRCPPPRAWNPLGHHRSCKALGRQPLKVSAPRPNNDPSFAPPRPSPPYLVLTGAAKLLTRV